MKSDFYWNEDYPFKKDKKYLIFFRGTMAPPSRGHFEAVLKYLNVPNVKVLVYHLATESRHGVPSETSRKIWKIYAKNALTREQRRNLIFQKGHDLESFSKITKGFDYIVYLKGNEQRDLIGDVQTNGKVDKKLVKRRRSYENKQVKKRKKFSTIAHENGARHFDFIFIDRTTHSSLSATAFVKAIKRREHMDDLAFFMPDTLPGSKAKKVVRMLKKYSLH